MTYKIIADSCCEFPEEYRNDDRFVNIPLGLEVNGEYIPDDETFDQKSFLKKVAESPKCPRSCCPSPEKYLRAYETDADYVFVFTLTSKLSGSYNSAVVAKSLYEEQHEPKKIFICDSYSASVGELQLALKAAKWCEEGMVFEEICRKLMEFRDRMKLYFVLDNLETLRKNGRITNVKSLVASTLSIKPIMGAKDGEIVQLGKAVGMKKALTKIVDMICSEIGEARDRTLMISQCNCPERAEIVRKLLAERCSFREIRVLEMAGVSTMYANDGGVIITV